MASTQAIVLVALQSNAFYVENMAKDQEVGRREGAAVEVVENVSADLDKLLWRRVAESSPDLRLLARIIACRRPSPT